MTTTKIYRSISDYESVPEMDHVKAHFADAWSKLFLSQFTRGTTQMRELAKISTLPKIVDVVLNALRNAVTIQISGRGDRDINQVVIKIDPRSIQDALHGRLDNKTVLACRRPTGDAEARLAWLDELLRLERRIEVTCSMRYQPRSITRIQMRNASHRPTWIEKQLMASLDDMKHWENWTRLDWRPC